MKDLRPLHERGSAAHIVGGKVVLGAKPIEVTLTEGEFKVVSFYVTRENLHDVLQKIGVIAWDRLTSQEVFGADTTGNYAVWTSGLTDLDEPIRLHECSSCRCDLPEPTTVGARVAVAIAMAHLKDVEIARLATLIRVYRALLAHPK